MDLHKIESWSKIIGATSIPLLGIAVTLFMYFDGNAQRRHEKNLQDADRAQQLQIEEANLEQRRNLENADRQARLFAEIMSNRERADSEIRASMFTTLLENYLKDAFAAREQVQTIESLRQEVLLLDLVINNFQEYFDTKPLFEDLYARLMELADAKPADGTDIRREIERLKGISSSAARKQEMLLSRVGTAIDFQIWKGSHKCIHLYETTDLKLTNRLGDLSPMLQTSEGKCKDRHPQRVAAPLDRLPEGFDAKERYKQLLIFDTAQKTLVVRGLLQEGDRGNLLSESDDASYQRAINQLVDESENRRKLYGDPAAFNQQSDRYSLDIQVTDISDDGVDVTLVVYNDFFVDSIYSHASDSSAEMSFSVSIFDLPFMDNTRLYSNERFALLLRKLPTPSRISAELGIVIFREDFMSVRDRPFFTQMLHDLSPTPISTEYSAPE